MFGRQQQCAVGTTERISLMAKKADLLEKAAELKLEVTEKNTIAEIEAAIADAEHREVKEDAPAKAGKRSQKALDEAAEKA